jgi:hypothetical protein
MEPEPPLVVRPELNDNMPLPLVGPESALRIEIVPLHEDLPSPDFIRTPPPEAAVLEPADTSSEPPAPLVPLPTEIKTVPPRPVVADPEPISTAPELPLLEVPVLNASLPLDPLVPALDVLTTMAPLDLVDPAPEAM